MVFNSIFFIFCFLPVFMLIYYLVPGKLRNLLLFLGSLIFYAWGEPVYVILMLFSSVFNYYMGTELERLYYDDKKQKLNLVLPSLSILAFLYFLNIMVSCWIPLAELQAFIFPIRNFLCQSGFPFIPSGTCPISLIYI